MTNIDPHMDNVILVGLPKVRKYLLKGLLLLRKRKKQNQNWTLMNVNKWESSYSKYKIIIIIFSYLVFFSKEIYINVT